MIQALAVEAVAPWWLTDTVEAGDVIGAWQAKAADDYAASLVNLNNPGTQDLTEVVGTVPWSAEAGWLADGINFLNTGFTESGIFESTHIQRFRRLHHTGSSIFYSDNVFGKMLVNKSGEAQIEIYHHSGGSAVWDTPDLTDDNNDFVLGVAGDFVYGNGVYQSTVPGYSIAAGSSTVTIAGAGPGGSGTGIDVYASAIYNRKLTATEVAAITANMQAL